MNLKSAAEAYKAKRIHVFENGSECSFGSSVIINTIWGRTWNKILAYITQVIKPTYGPVRHLKSIDGKESIHSFTDLINGERYVACGKENFRNVSNGYHTEPEYRRLKRKTCSQHYNKINMKEGNNKDKYWALLQAQKNKRTVIHVFSNGIKHQAAVKFVLVEADLYNWQRLLGHMSNMMDKPEGITSLFTIFGQRVCGPCAVQHGAYYVAVAFGEQFEKLDYMKGQKEYLLNRKKHTDLMEELTVNAIGSPTHILTNNDDCYFKKYLDVSRKSKSGPLIFDTRNIKTKDDQQTPRRRMEMLSKKDNAHYAKIESLLHAEEKFLNELRKELEETTGSQQKTKPVRVKKVGKDRKRTKVVDVKSDSSVASKITECSITSRNYISSSCNEQHDVTSLCSDTAQTSHSSSIGKNLLKKTNKTSVPSRITIDSENRKDKKRTKVVDVKSDTSVASKITQCSITSRNHISSSYNGQHDVTSLCSDTAQTSHSSTTGKNLLKKTNKTSVPSRITIDSENHQLTTVSSHRNEENGITSQKQTESEHKQKTLKSNRRQSSVPSKLNTAEGTVSNITITEIKKPSAGGLSVISNMIPSTTSMNIEVESESLKGGHRLSQIARILNDVIMELDRKNNITKSALNNQSISSNLGKTISLGKELSDVNANSSILKTLNTSKVFEPAISEEVKVEETGFKVVINRIVKTNNQVIQTEPLFECETQTDLLDNDFQTSETQMPDDDSTMPSDLMSDQAHSVGPIESMLDDIDSSDSSSDFQINQHKLIAIASVVDVITTSFEHLDKQHINPKTSIYQRRSTGFNFGFHYPLYQVDDNEDEAEDQSPQSKPSEISELDVSSVSGCFGLGALDHEDTRSALSKLSSTKNDKSEEERSDIKTQENFINQDVVLNQDDTSCKCDSNMETNEKCICEETHNENCPYEACHDDLSISSQNIDLEDKTETHLLNQQAKEKEIIINDEEKLISIDSTKTCKCDSEEGTEQLQEPCQCESNHDQKMSCSNVCSYENTSRDVNVLDKNNSSLQNPAKEYGKSKCIAFLKKIFYRNS